VWGFDQYYISSSSSGVAPGILGAVGEAIGDTTIPMKLVSGLGDVDSAGPSYALWAMSRTIRASAQLMAEFDGGVAGLIDRLYALDTDTDTDTDVAKELLVDGEAFLLEYGSRGPNEWEISAETWETKPEMALAMLDRVRHQDDLGNEELSAMYEGALVAANFMVYRERTKTNIIKTVHGGRMVFRELGRRHAEAGNIADPFHIFMLVSKELDAFVIDPASFNDTLARRHTEWR
jgi:hypothetical protein